jgi:hypothetical protein
MMLLVLKILSSLRASDRILRGRNRCFDVSLDPGNSASGARSDLDFSEQVDSRGGVSGKLNWYFLSLLSL